MERRNAWKVYDQTELEKLDKINETYKNCLDDGKTERECITLAVKKAEAAGYKNLKELQKEHVKLKAGDKVYAVCMDKSIALFIIGQEPLENGMNILGAHIDSPRIDVKQNPLYENEELAYLDTHYYGGIKKYQWVTLPLALHGVIAKKDGTIVPVSIGDEEEEPVFVAPGGEYADGTGYEGHAFFEAPSIRKIGNTYYLIYSSSVMHELCYATSEKPTGKFTYRGVLVSNCDMHIDTYKPADMPSAYGGNNHGSIVEISSEWYIFYHRQTNGTWYSRQGCAEKLHLAEDGSFRQVELTSCGLNGGSLVGRGEYPAYIACNLFTAEESIFDANQRFPRVMQDGRDGDKEPGYISHITDTTTLGFKYFECENVQKVILKVRGYGSGTFEVKTAWDGEVLGTVQIVNSNVWEKYEIQAQIPDGKQAIYFTYRGYGNLDLLSFTLE